MVVTVKVPAKVILFGEHAVCHGESAIVSAVDKYLTLSAEYTGCNGILLPQEFSENPFVTRVVSYLSDYTKVHDGIAVRVDECDIPVGYGMGSSSAVCVGLSALFLLASGRVTSQLTHRERSSIEKVALDAERHVNCDVSGVDTHAVVQGGVRKFKGRFGRPFVLEDVCGVWVIQTNTEHSSFDVLRSCRGKDVIYRKIGEIVDSVEIGDDKDTMSNKAIENNKLLCELGLSIADNYTINRVVPSAKISGGGVGGIMTCYDLSGEQVTELCELGFKRPEFVKFNTRGLEVSEPGKPLYLEILDSKIWKKVDIQNVTKTIGYSSSPSNIALVKYWGKKHSMRQMAINDSLSMTIPGFRSFTSVFLSDVENEDERSAAFLRELCPHKLNYSSYNNFPSSCGIASSASGYSALVGGVSDLFNIRNILTKKEMKYWLENWCRLGSGSACRSLYSGMVAWKYQHSESVSPLELGHAVVVFDQSKKKVSSSKGHTSVHTSVLQHYRTHLSSYSLTGVNEAILDEDYGRLQTLVENDTMFMHAVMMTSDPPARYISHECMAFVSDFIHFRQKFNLDTFFTIDAGANPHVLYTEGSRERVENWLRKRNDPKFVLFNRHNGTGMVTGKSIVDKLAGQVLLEKYYPNTVIVLSGKRYSGKTYLAEKLSDVLGVPILTISENIKKEYCTLNGLSFQEMETNRSLKEQHRKQMIHFREKYSSERWIKKLWDQRPGTGKNMFIVSDARRCGDISFLSGVARVVHIRVAADENLRRRRGWVQSEIDNMESETGLDNSSPDMVFKSGVDDLNKILDFIST